MANKAFEDKKHEMEATMVNLGDKVGSNITQVNPSQWINPADPKPSHQKF